MENRNCKKCGRVFSYESGYPLCKECREQDEGQFKVIREYIRLHPGVRIDEVARDLDVPLQLVLRYVKEERLMVTGDEDVFISCELCGRSIKTGRFCDSCKQTIASELRLEHDKAQAEGYFYNDREEQRIRSLKFSDKPNKR